MRKTLLAVAAVVATIFSTLVVTQAAEAAGTVRVTRWVDGDTVLTNRGTVRLIGFDTPERGRCGYKAATAIARQIAPVGTIIQLGNPSAVKDKDRYGRLLRYVNRASRDVAVAQLRHGAWARYDSRDGYQWHPRQALYRRLDAGTRNYCGYKPGGSSTSEPTPTSGGSTSAAVAPLGHDCPSYAPIKGNESSMIYHRPGQEYYAVTTPEACIRDSASAEAAGYRASKI